MQIRQGELFDNFHNDAFKLYAVADFAEIRQRIKGLDKYSVGIGRGFFSQHRHNFGDAAFFEAGGSDIGKFFERACIVKNGNILKTARVQGAARP